MLGWGRTGVNPHYLAFASLGTAAGRAHELPPLCKKPLFFFTCGGKNADTGPFFLTLGEEFTCAKKIMLASQVDT
jgi:hypothetical protein